ncbi:hypothetical protein GC169_05615 [bacterium]|nr:hypothetical protein [bacterium]
MIADPDVYFADGCGRCDRFATADCSARRWEAGLRALRRICLGCGLEEAAKWGHPCYVHKGRNIAIIGAFRDDFRISFFNAALMQDPEGALERQGPNTRHPDMLRFTDPSQPTTRERLIRSYLLEAMSYADAGVKPARSVESLELPDELVEALDADPVLAEAFHTLTPGRQRSYVINLAAAKHAETRVSRIMKFRARILAGKGALER